MILKGYVNIYQMRWASCESVFPYVHPMQYPGHDSNNMILSNWFCVSMSGFTRYLKPNWGFLVKRKKTATLLPSCFRQVIYSFWFACSAQFNVTVCLLAVYKLYSNTFRYNLCFSHQDDGGHTVGLHHDLQTAQWSFRPAASRRELHTGRVKVANHCSGASAPPQHHRH